jgi:hypothetical protein
MEAVLSVARREPAWWFAGALGADVREPVVPAQGGFVSAPPPVVP